MGGGREVIPSYRPPGCVEVHNQYSSSAFSFLFLSIFLSLSIYLSIFSFLFLSSLVLSLFVAYLLLAITLLNESPWNGSFCLFVTFFLVPLLLFLSLLILLLKQPLVL